MKLDANVKCLFDLFKSCNKKLYIVGGAVRDYLLGNESYDYDFTTDATPFEIIDILHEYQLDTYQKDLGSVKVHIDNNIYEITTMRKEYGVINNRYPEKVVFVKNFKEDVLRRDFTCNAIGFNPDEGVVDYLDGINDINKKLIKFIIDPAESISLDPIRLIRALRFCMTLGFEVDERTYKIMVNNAHKVSLLGVIRFNELFRLITLDDSYEFIKKHFFIYTAAFPEIDKDLFIKLLNNKINYKLFKIAICFITKIDISLTKQELNILSALDEANKYEQSLYNTKLLLIKYQNNLEPVLEILSALGYNVEEFVNNLSIIRSENHALYIKDLKITYLDLENLNIDKKLYSKVLKHLLNEVLLDNSKNTKEILIECLKSTPNI